MYLRRSKRLCLNLSPCHSLQASPSSYAFDTGIFHRYHTCLWLAIDQASRGTIMIYISCHRYDVIASSNLFFSHLSFLISEVVRSIILYSMAHDTGSEVKSQRKKSETMYVHFIISYNSMSRYIYYTQTKLLRCSRKDMNLGRHANDTRPPDLARWILANFKKLPASSFDDTGKSIAGTLTRV